jgi:hypothetical protein
MRMFAVMMAAFDNPFGPARVTGIEVDLEIEYRRDVLQIIAATTTEDEVEPGALVPVYLQVRRWGEPDTTRVVQVRIPRHVAGRRCRSPSPPAPRRPVSTAGPATSPSTWRTSATATRPPRW